MFLESLPTYVYILIVGGAILALFGVSLPLIIKSKKKEPKIKIDDEFITKLIMALGSLTNIKNVSVDNGRLKIEVNDLDVVDSNSLKDMNSNGVFITGNNIKLLFKYDSNTIKNALNSRLK